MWYAYRFLGNLVKRVVLVDGCRTLVHIVERRIVLVELDVILKLFVMAASGIWVAHHGVRQGNAFFGLEETFLLLSDLRNLALNSLPLVYEFVEFGEVGALSFVALLVFLRRATG